MTMCMNVAKNLFSFIAEIYIFLNIRPYIS